MKTILAIILALFTLEVVAQNHLVGAAGGLNRTNVSANHLFRETEGKQSVSGGITYEYFLKPGFSIGADALYQERGFTVDFKEPTGELKSINYLYAYSAVPLKTAFYRAKNKKALFAKIGLTPALLINAKTTSPTLQPDGTIGGMETYNVKRYVNKFDLAGLVEIGGGYKLIARFWLTTSFIYQHSLTLIANPDYFANSTIRHKDLSLNLGLKWAWQQDN